MPSSCQEKGVPCLCSKFRKGKQGKGCRDCGHSKHRHITNPDATPSAPPMFQPQDTVSSILAHQMKRHGRKVTKKKKQATKSVKFQQIGSLLFLLCGMWAHTDPYSNNKIELRSDKPLAGPEEEELHQEGVHLLVDADATGCPLEFSPDWSIQAIDKWLHGLTPKLFQYLDLTYGVRDGIDDKYHWRLVRQQHKRMFLFSKELVNGTDLGKCIGGQARKKETFQLHITTRHPIDKAVWMNFDRAIRVAQKKAEPNFVDAIERKPVDESCSSEEDNSSEAGSDDFEEEEDRKASKDFDLEVAMESAVESVMESSSDEEAMLTKPTLTNKHQVSPAPPLFYEDVDTDGPSSSPKANHSGLNANGKRRATSPPSPPAYNTRLAKRARRTLMESTEPEPEAEQAATLGTEEGGAGSNHLGALFIEGVDFNEAYPPTPPGFHHYYYSPAPDSPPLPPAGSPGLTCMIRDSPGRLSKKTAWKKRNPS
ncbi:hypothetical protein V8D89_005959 [Ganoderma adspersum]